jgi:hypothetical protein
VVKSICLASEALSSNNSAAQKTNKTNKKNPPKTTRNMFYLSWVLRFILFVGLILIV